MSTGNTILFPVDFHASEDFDFCCGDCGRNVKRAVTLTDGKIRGLDCAATAMGRTKGKRVYDAIEMDARTESARIAARAYTTALPKPARSCPEYAGYMATARASCPYPGNSLEWHAFMGAL